MSSVLAVLLLLAWSLFGLSTRDSLADNDSVAPTVSAAGPIETDRPLEADSVEAPAEAASRSTATQAESATTPVSPFIPDKSAAPAVRRIVGRVLDVDDRKPVADCRLEFVQDARSSKVIVTDRLGHFETPAIFAAGIVEVRNQSFWMSSDAEVHATIRPSRIWMDRATDPATPTELELIATPAARIDVEVRDPDSSPASGAIVFPSFSPRRDRIGDREAEDSWSMSTTVRCDESGRGKFYISRDHREVCALNLQAVSQGHVGRLATVEPPLPTQPIVLALDVGGEVHVHVVDPRRSPVPELEVLASPGDGATGVTWTENTDEDGRASFSMMPFGNYKIEVDDALTRRACQQRVNLADGGNVEVELVLPDSPTRLALRGLVLDEDGAPLSGVQVRVIAGPNEIQSDQSGPDGTFEAWALPSDEVTVEVGTRMTDDLFEPERARVAFGTTNFVVRKAREVEHHRLAVTVIDRSTRQPIRSAQLFMAAIYPSDSFDRWSMKDGLANATITDRPNAHVLFAARGYKPLLRPCRELLPPIQPLGYITIELEPGFECRLTVVDATTSEPLANVEFRQPSGTVLRSDAQGVVVLAAREWPPAYHVEREGYQPIEWDPRDWPAWKSALALEKLVR